MKLDLWSRTGTVTLPKEKALAVSDDLLLDKKNYLNNFTQRVPGGEIDPRAGTLSAGTLQALLEYTTKPRDIVLTFNAHFGQIYLAAENCGRLVFGTEGFKYFGETAENRVNRTIGFSGKVGGPFLSGMPRSGVEKEQDARREETVGGVIANAPSFQAFDIWNIQKKQAKQSVDTQLKVGVDSRLQVQGDNIKRKGKLIRKTGKSFDKFVHNW